MVINYYNFVIHPVIMKNGKEIGAIRVVYGLKD